MREVAPGDLIFSFAKHRISAIGIARTHCYESRAPKEFVSAGGSWDQIGWRVSVSYIDLKNKIYPKDNINLINSHLPSKYSPLQDNGKGKQVYLTEISSAFADVILRLIGDEAWSIHRNASSARQIPEIDLERWENEEEHDIKNNVTLAETDRQALIWARKGQGLFKDRVSQIEPRCRITGVENPTHLIASHSKPWRRSNNAERLDGENGFLMTPNIDHLYDRGFIGFEDNGDIIISPVADVLSLRLMGIDPEKPKNVGTFSPGQKQFLAFHREEVLLKSAKS